MLTKLVIIAATIDLCFLSAVYSNEQICNTEACKAISKERRSYMNLSVDPCKDFYEYACGNFHKYHPVGKSMFDLRMEALNAEIAQALDDTNEYDSNSTAVQFLTKLYHQCNQTDANGLEQLKRAIKELHEGVPYGHWAMLFAKLIGRFGVNAFLKIATTEVNIKSGSNWQYIRRAEISTASGGVSSDILVSSDYQKAVEQYRIYMHKATILMGAPDNTATNKTIDRMIALERKLAKARGDNPYFGPIAYTLDELNKKTEHIDWVAFLTEVSKQTNASRKSFTETNMIEVAGDDAVFNTVEVLNAAEPNDVQNLLNWILAQRYGPLVSEKFYEYQIEFRRALNDTRPVLRNQACFDLARSKLFHVVERVYADQYFKEDVHRKSAQMIDDLRRSLKAIIEETTWLDSKTKAYAVKKLDAMKTQLGAPNLILNSTLLDEYYDFVGKVDIVPNQLLESVFSLQRVFIREAFDFNGTKLNELSKAWKNLPPLTPDAANFFTLNQIVIPTGIIRPPFFASAWPNALNYGHLGSIIGHELTHGFDNKGRRYDKQGNEHNWWSERTLNEFLNRSQCFVDQYGLIYDSRAKLHVNGEKTLAENIADNGGLKESYRAFESQSNRFVLPDLKANSKQLFFLSFAWNYCDTYSPEMLHKQILTDEHSPSRYRALVPLRNLPDFAKAFNCPTESDMNPSHKCAVW